MPAKKKGLDSLRPCAGKHSVQEIVFTIFLSPQAPISNPERFIEIHKGQLKKDFPKLNFVQMAEARLPVGGANEPIAMRDFIIGFSFEAFKPDGALHRRIRCEQAGDRFWLAVNMLEYGGWGKAKSQAKNWLRKIALFADKMPNVAKPMAIGSSLHYIDHLYWDSAEKPDLGLIFNSNSSFLPARMNDDVEGWNCRIGYQQDKDEFTQVDSVNVMVHVNPKTGHQRYAIDMPLLANLRNLIPLRKFVEEKSEVGFEAIVDRLHDDNETYLRDMLTTEVLTRIGLNQ